MAKSNYLAEDFQEVSEKSDEVVFELLKQKELQKTDGKNTGKTAEPVTSQDAAKETPPEQVVPEIPVHALHQTIKPNVALNTRIPQELSDLIDDLVYQSKKQGHPTSKQAIAIEALWSHLKKLGFSS